MMLKLDNKGVMNMKKCLFSAWDREMNLNWENLENCF